MFRYIIHELDEEEKNSEQNKKFILSLDIGTTSVRSFIYNFNYDVVGQAKFEVKFKFSKPNYIEIDTDAFFKSILKIMKESLNDAKISAEELLCMGICCSRATFTTWDKASGKIFHDLITWKDLRSAKIVNDWNKSLFAKVLRGGSSVLYAATNKKHFKQGKYFKLSTMMVAPRLLWVKNYNRNLKKAIAHKGAFYGALETWLLYKFKTGALDFNEDISELYEHVSDCSNSSVTGFFDPFSLSYAWWAFLSFKIEKKMLPKIVDNDYDFGYTHSSLFGTPVKIAAIITDQSASMWGNCCFRKGDIKMTIGTVAIININTGNKCEAIGHGYYPLVAWRLLNRKTKKKETIYKLEYFYPESNLIIQMSQKMGLFSDPMDTSNMAVSVEDPGEIFFIPANVDKNCIISGFHGVTKSSTKEQLVRAILEGIAFTIADMFLPYKRKCDNYVERVRIDGGLSSNDFLCQTLANLCNITIERSTSIEMSAQGLAYLCAYNCGKFKDFNEISKLYKIGKVFRAETERAEILQRMGKWKKFYRK